MQGVLRAGRRRRRQIVDLLNAEIDKAMALPDVKAKCAQLGFDPVADTPEEFAAYIKKEVDKWGKVINGSEDLRRSKIGLHCRPDPCASSTSAKRRSRSSRRSPIRASTSAK